PYFDLPQASEIEFNRYGELRKAPRLVRHVLTNVAPMFADRDGGFTRIVKLGRRRLGDAAELVMLQLVGREEGPEVGGGGSGRRRQADRRTAFAARFKKPKAEPAPETEAAETAETEGSETVATAEAETATDVATEAPPEDEAPAQESDDKAGS
ncbi:MAG: L17 family ribosomal protein, partial [Planctomycetota bacterium]